MSESSLISNALDRKALLSASRAFVRCRLVDTSLKSSIRSLVYL